MENKMKCHKGAKENIFHFQTKYNELHDMPHIFETSVAPRYNRSLAEHIKHTEDGANKSKSKTKTTTPQGDKAKGPTHTGLEANKKTDRTPNKPPVVTIPDEKGSKNTTKKSRGRLSQNVQKPSVQKESTVQDGLTKSTQKGNHVRGSKVNNKSIKSNVQSPKGSGSTVINVSKDGVKSVDSSAALSPPKKLNANNKKDAMPNSPNKKVSSSSEVNKKGEKTTNSSKGSPPKKLNANNKKDAMPNSPNKKVSSSSEVNKKGEKTTNSSKGSPPDALKAKNKPANHSSGKVEASKLQDYSKEDDATAQKLNELLYNQKDNKRPEHSSMQVTRNQLNDKEEVNKPNNYPFKNTPPSGLVVGKRLCQAGDLRLKNKLSSGLTGSQENTELQAYPLKNVPRSDLENKPRDSKSIVLKNIPSDEQQENEKNAPNESAPFPSNKGEYDINVLTGEFDNKKYVTKVYHLKKGKFYKENLDGIIHGVNDKLTLEIQDFESYGTAENPFKSELPELKEYNESSNMSKDYQLKNEQPDLKKYDESNISNEGQQVNNPNNLKEYNESHLAGGNQLKHDAPTGLKEFEKPDETRDYGLKGHTDSEIGESELKEPKNNNQSSSQGTKGNINAQSDGTVSTLAKPNDTNTQGKKYGISGNIPPDVDSIKKTLETVVCALKENEAGDLVEYIETHTTKHYELKTDVKDGIKQYDEKLENASYGFREKLPVKEVKEYDVVEREFKKPIKVKKKEKIKPIKHYSYTYNGLSPKSRSKNYGLLDLFSFTFNILMDRNVYLVKKEHMSLYKLGKKAMRGQLTHELMHEYVTHCVKQKNEGKKSKKIA
eukprot:XP_002260513.1 hypothetical protein, conserved in Plasmodium species [Plasmodium knowlesi strain H]